MGSEVSVSTVACARSSKSVPKVCYRSTGSPKDPPLPSRPGSSSLSSSSSSSRPQSIPVTSTRMKMDSLEMMIDADSCYFEERTMVLRDRINESFSMRHVPSRLMTREEDREDQENEAGSKEARVFETTKADDESQGVFEMEGSAEEEVKVAHLAGRSRRWTTTCRQGRPKSLPRF